jgi:hypothetical protein
MACFRNLLQAAAVVLHTGPTAVARHKFIVEQLCPCSKAIQPYDLLRDDVVVNEYASLGQFAGDTADVLVRAINSLYSFWVIVISVFLLLLLSPASRPMFSGSASRTYMGVFNEEVER